MNAGTSEYVALCAEVTGVSPLASGETVKRKRWIVQLEVTDILHGTPPVEIGDALAVRVS